MALHPTDYKALGILDRLGPMSAGQLAAHTGLAAASITSLVDRLEARGFARRVHDSQDRRRVLVEAAEERLRGGRHLFPIHTSIAGAPLRTVQRCPTRHHR
jgi:DNA-binding MarR family transcriptional regulator